MRLFRERKLCKRCDACRGLVCLLGKVALESKARNSSSPPIRHAHLCALLFCLDQGHGIGPRRIPWQSRPDEVHEILAGDFLNLRILQVRQMLVPVARQTELPLDEFRRSPPLPGDGYLVASSLTSESALSFATAWKWMSAIEEHHAGEPS